ncbi:hypothetical protein K1719_042213 [Acacia pycnantha]|nr:hypothetical protein K1719_042213 [Acacia pycnantha]
MKYGGGRWNKIAKSFVKNKTARQVERHATSFFLNFLETHVSSRAAKASTSDNIALSSNPKNDNKMKEGEEDMGPPRTLVLFSNGETSSSSNNEISEKTTTRTCVVDNDDDELDLELRLG